MAVDSKQGVNAGNGFPTTGPTNGAVTNGTRRRKRPSSLMEAATSLPSVETSLDEFIARANSTLVDLGYETRRADEKTDEGRGVRALQHGAQFRIHPDLQGETESGGDAEEICQAAH